MSNKIVVNPVERKFYFTFAACLLLTACATTPHTVALKPPSELTQEVTEPVLPASPTNGDLARFADELRAALREANRRLRAVGSL
jgi:starvation-inducible outer membrane lipoprotein